MTLPTLQQTQAADKRQGYPGQASPFPRPGSQTLTGKQPKRKSPWTEHLLSLSEDCDPAHLGAVLNAVSAANGELRKVYGALERKRVEGFRGASTLIRGVR